MTTTGCVQILARDKVRGGHVDVNGLDIVAADARGEKERPHGYGVYVINAADRWTAEAKITSHGPSGIGFVNFGIVHELKVNAPIETFGQGCARLQRQYRHGEPRRVRPRHHPRG